MYHNVIRSVLDMDISSNIEQLAWDEWNLEHLTKRGVIPEEVAEVLNGNPVIRDTDKNRLAVISPTQAGRVAMVIIGPDPTITGLY